MRPAAATATSASGANAALKNLILIDGIDKESVDVPNFADKEVPMIVTTVAPELEEYARQMLVSGIVDLNSPIDLDNYVEDAVIIEEND